jgi:hypothetical protein
MSGLPGTKQACWAQVREKNGDAMKSLASVLSGNGAKAAVRELRAQFERATGNAINLK